jgi:2-desacetyl-2-hydroxyethyl bacteriochlorophyllide A dehydrogenase
MKAAVLVEPEKIQVMEVPLPRAGDGQLLVRVALAGVCGSDHTLYHGKFGVPLPVIPGHEMVGRVEAMGPGVTGWSVGQRVTLQPNIACGRCPLCRDGHRNLCPHKVRLGADADGVFAEYAVIPAAYAWPVPERLSDEIAVFAEPLAVVVHALGRAAPQPGERALIIGAGVIGLLTQQLAAAAGAEVTACDIAPARLALARELGAAHAFSATGPLESFENRFHLVYDTSGAPGGLALATRLACPRATVVLLGLPSAEHPVATTLIVRKELRILGSLIYTDEFPKALELLQNGAVATAPLVSGIRSLSDVDDVLRHFAAPERIKTLVRPG